MTDGPTYAPPAPPLPLEEDVQESCKDTNPKDGAATSRLDLSLIPSSALVYMALALTEGHCKYGGFNWREAGVKASVYRAGGMRHFDKWWNGQDVDPKSLVHELGSVLANVAILIDAIECGMLVDDRPPVQDMAGLLNHAEETVKHLQATFPNGPKRYTER